MHRNRISAYPPTPLGSIECQAARLAEADAELAAAKWNIADLQALAAHMTAELAEAKQEIERLEAENARKSKLIRVQKQAMDSKDAINDSMARAWKIAVAKRRRMKAIMEGNLKRQAELEAAIARVEKERRESLARSYQRIVVEGK